jgi:hypothetical protein
MGRPYLLQREVGSLVVGRLGRTLVEALGSCRIDHLVEGSWYRIRVGSGMRDRILPVAVCLGATAYNVNPQPFPKLGRSYSVVC